MYDLRTKSRIWMEYLKGQVVWILSQKVLFQILRNVERVGQDCR